MSENLFAFNAAIAAIGTVIATALGGWDSALGLLTALIVIDYASGLFVAISTKQLSSQIGFVGICKKVMILFLIFIAALADKAANTSFLRDVVVFFYIANEAVSVFENTAKLGVPYPKKMKDFFVQLGKSVDSGNDETVDIIDAKSEKSV